MNRQCGRFVSLVPVLLFVLLPGPARAEFILEEDFDNLLLGPIGGQAGWVAPSSLSEVAADPVDPANQILSVVTESTHLRRNLLLLNDTVRMFFVRFRFAEQLNFSFGLSGQLYPFHFGDFDVELNLSNVTGELRVNDDGSYRVLTVVEPHVWYNCWILVDNQEDETQIWLHDRDGEPALATDQLAIDGETDFGFRGAVCYDIHNIFIKTGGGSGLVGPLFLDDIYLENTSSLNLTNPTAGVTAAPPAAVAAVTLAPCYPNPFNPQTAIEFSLPRQEHVRLDVFALDGRLVRTLVDEVRDEGSQTVVWNGRDESGQPAASGTYLYRLQTSLRTLSRTMVLLK